MASGILGTSSPSAASWTTLYTVPTAKTATCNLIVTNRNSTLAKFRAAASTGASPSAGEHIAYDWPLNPAGSPGCVASITGIALEAARKLLVYADSTNVDFVLTGYEA